ncbi:MAG: SRPBCC domain-containing protein, partial [Polyangiaceae bacterium]
MITELKQHARAILTTPSDREFRLERSFNAPRDKVWKALTEPELIEQWWGRGNPLTIERFELERGGHWRFVEHSEHGVHGFEGRYREIVPLERMVLSFEWDGMPGYVIINTLTLADLPHGRTQLVSTSLF